MSVYTKPKYNTKSYRGSNYIRKFIINKEGSDMPGQDKLFGGDAVGAKERELRKWWGRSYENLSDNQRDALLSHYYNVKPTTFYKSVAAGKHLIDNAVNENDFNKGLELLSNSFNTGRNWKGMGGLRIRRDEERNIFLGRDIKFIDKVSNNPIVANTNNVVSDKEFEFGNIVLSENDINDLVYKNNRRVNTVDKVVEQPVINNHTIEVNLPKSDVYEQFVNNSNEINNTIKPMSKLKRIKINKDAPKSNDNVKFDKGGVYVLRKKDNTNYNPLAIEYKDMFDVSSDVRKRLETAKHQYDNDIKNNRQNANSKYAFNLTNLYNGDNANNITNVMDYNKYKSSVKTNDAGRNKTNRVINTITKGINNLTTNDVALGANTIGSIAGYIINRNAINKMKAPPPPAPIIDANLKTKVNINPQLDALSESYNQTAKIVDANTANSRDAIYRKQQANLQNIIQRNTIEANKENAETDLINKARLNQQQTAANNAQMFNNWRDRVTEHNNKIIETKSENAVNLIDNINNGVQDVIARRERQRAIDNNILAMMAASPNVSPEFVSKSGLGNALSSSIRKKLLMYSSKK